MLRRYVNVVDFFFRKFGDFVPSSASDTRVQESALFVERFVSLRDYESVFFVGGKVIYYIRNLARRFIYSSVSRFDKPVFVYFGVSRKRSDKTDVLTFGGFYRTHTSVVSIVNVADFESGAFSVQTARPQRGKFTLMRKFGDRVRLIHELITLSSLEIPILNWFCKSSPTERTLLLPRWSILSTVPMP